MTDQTQPTAKLLPCPFSTGDDHGLSIVPASWDMQTEEIFSYQIECECGIAGQSHPTKAEAIAAWNARS
jgi:hypothetical protein